MFKLWKDFIEIYSMFCQQNIIKNNNKFVIEETDKNDSLVMKELCKNWKADFIKVIIL